MPSGSITFTLTILKGKKKPPGGMVIYNFERKKPPGGTVISRDDECTNY